MATQKFIDAWDDIIAKWMKIPCVCNPSNYWAVSFGVAWQINK